MKTAKETLMYRLGISKFDSLQAFPLIDQETVIKAMEDYKEQFVNDKCEHDFIETTGKIEKFKCKKCDAIQLRFVTIN